jgi:putative transposase
MARTPCYPTDLTDGQWALVAPLLPPPVPAGAPRTTDLRAVLDAAFYLTASGCAWYALPADFPPEGTVRSYFHAWRRDGTWRRVHDALRAEVRRAAGKEPDPSAGSVDSQSVKSARTAGTRGFDGGKKNLRGQAAPAG